MIVSIEEIEMKADTQVVSSHMGCKKHRGKTTIKYEINVTLDSYEEITPEKIFEKAMLSLIEQFKKQNFELPVYVVCPEGNKKKVDVEEKKKYYNPTNVELYLLGCILSDKSLVEEIKGRLNDTSQSNFDELAKKLASKYEENKGERS